MRIPTWRNSFKYVSGFLSLAKVNFFGLPIVVVIGLERNIYIYLTCPEKVQPLSM